MDTMYDILPYGWLSLAALLLAPPDTAGAAARSGTGDQVAIKSNPDSRCGGVRLSLTTSSTRSSGGCMQPKDLP